MKHTYTDTKINKKEMKENIPVTVPMATIVNPFLINKYESETVIAYVHNENYALTQFHKFLLSKV